jgi:hypothetical protein
MLRTKLRSVFTLCFLVLASVTTLAFGTAPSTAAAGQVTATSTPDFSVTVTPLSQTRKRGTGAPYFVTINCLNGFSGAVTLSLTGDIPPNVVVSITNPTGCGSLSDGEVNLQIEKHSTTTGTFAMTIQAVSGTLEHDVGISLTIV